MKPISNRAVVPLALLAALCLSAPMARAEEITIPVNAISADGIGEPLGAIVVTAEDGKPKLAPDLTGLAPGAHAFHIHENPDCGPAEKDGVMVAGLAAGGHYDPQGAMGHGDHDHEGMAMEKPAGDLRELVIDPDGVSRQAVIVESLAFDQLRGRAIMIHAYSEQPDDPDLPKGGGPRVACGVIPTG